MARLKAEEYKTFEEIKHVSEDGLSEWWSARELAEAIDYSQWRNFQKVLERAIAACENSGADQAGHFAQSSKMVEIGSSTYRKVIDYKLSRYACYLIVQNADPHKEIVALAQTYFAIQTRRQEVQAAFNELDENSKRLIARGNVKQWNQMLAEAAYIAGVITDDDFKVFQNAGYMGLYGGLAVADIHELKGLNEDDKILDFMGSSELIANLFRISQTEEMLKREHVSSMQEASNTHFAVAEKIRKAILEMGATLPENLPVAPDISLVELAEIEKLHGQSLMLDE